MSCNNYIIPSAPSSGSGAGLSNAQPATAGFWLNAGVLTFWNGTTNQVLDFNEGDKTSLFGTPLGDI